MIFSFQMTVKQRLKDYLKVKNIGQKDFAQQVGLSDGFVNAIRVSIQPKSLHKIAVCFSDLNTGWLLTGEGEMLRSDEKKPDVENEDFRNKYIKLLELRIEEQDKTIETLRKIFNSQRDGREVKSENTNSG